jgi:beta-glucosidase
LGQETGHAVADVLFGTFNPGGKLPISIPRSVGHIPCFYNHKPSARRGYLFDDITPLYPFGFGLSYTTFRFSNLRLENPTIRKNEKAKVLIDVTNTGNRAGSEVVQMYIRDLFSTVTRPVKELRGFKKIWLEPNESKAVVFDILPEHLAFTNIEKEYVVEPGDFEIKVGNSSLDRDLTSVILHVE